MIEKLDIEIITKLLLILVIKSPYAAAIIAEVPKASRLVNENIDLNNACSDILKHSDFLQTFRLNYSPQIKPAIEIINNFFEYLYFTSQEFLDGVK